MIRYDSACRQVFVFVSILEFFTTVDFDNYECICLRGCMSMHAEEVDEYDFMRMDKEGVCDCTSMHVERAEIIEHSPFVPPITHPTINYQHHLNSGLDS